MIYIPDGEMALPTDTVNHRKNCNLLALYERYIPQTVGEREVRGSWWLCACVSTGFTNNISIALVFGRLRNSITLLLYFDM